MENACQYNIEKAKAILCTSWRKQMELKMNGKVMVGGHPVQHNTEAMK